MNQRKQSNRIFIDEKLTIKVIPDCRTRSAHKFTKKIKIQKNDVTLKKEQSVLTKIISSFKGENMQTQYVLGYMTDLYFHDYKLTKGN